MNVFEKEKRLKELLEHNIRNEKIGTAIAITGSWGVGKTFFWDKFLKEVTYKEINDKKSFYYEASRFSYESTFDCRKYAYISLFGIENLSDLKNTICTKLSLNPHVKSDSNKFEFFQLVKNVAAQFRDMKVSQYGVSASAKILESLLFLQVKDAIICFDDFERMSSKLDINDVMGLANYLKLEKNCQIILILDEERAKADNKRKYAEYKEKLVDETIIINSVEPLIRENAKDFDESLIELLLEFSETLEIHNFRFFQKVIKLYQSFRKELPPNAAYSTKEIILTRIIQGYLIADYGNELKICWEDFTIEELFELFDKNEDDSLNDVRIKVLKNLDKVFNGLFNDSDGWFIQFKNWFEQKDTVNLSTLHDLANSELISEENNKNKEELDLLMTQWRNLNIDKDYCDQLFKRSRATIKFNDLVNLDFHCFLLKKFGRNDLSKSLKREVFSWLASCMEKDIVKTWDDATHFGYKSDNLFHRYIRIWKLNNPQKGLSNLHEILSRFILKGGWNDSAKTVLQQATIKDWDSFLWNQNYNQSELNEITKDSLLKKILRQRIDPDLTPHIKITIETILVNKVKNTNDPYQKMNIEFVIENLKKDGLL